MVRETVSSSERSNANHLMALQVSVKDSSRFDGDWGFFDFTGNEGTMKSTAIPADGGCRSCHQDDAETDHVFTQFYPVLRSARAESLPALPSHYSAKC
jgi:hypothetical protein